MVIRKALSLLERQVTFSRSYSEYKNEPDMNSVFIGTYSLVEELRHSHQPF